MSRVRTSLATACLAVIVLFAAAAAQAQTTTYTVTDLGSLGDFDTFAFSVNDATEIAGYSYVAANPGFVRHGYLWRDGVMNDLGTLVPDGYSWATDVNEAGHVVGHATGPNGYGTPFLDTGSGLMDLMPPTDTGEARGVNNRTEVVGYMVDLGGTLAAYVWDAGSGFTTLPPLGGASVAALAERINDHGEVVGWSHPSAPCGGPGGLLGPRPAVWIDDGFGYVPTDLGTLGSDCFGHAYDVNEFGIAVGDSGGLTTPQPVRWVRAAGGAWSVKSLGSLGGIGTAYGVNNREQIVGESGNKAFLWQCGTMVDLNTKIPAGSGWHLERATAINDGGDIVGWGKLNGGDWRGFLLTPRKRNCCCKCAVAVATP